MDNANRITNQVIEQADVAFTCEIMRNIVSTDDLASMDMANKIQVSIDEKSTTKKIEMLLSLQELLKSFDLEIRRLTYIVNQMIRLGLPSPWGKGTIFISQVEHAASLERLKDEVNDIHALTEVPTA
jgi:hypothetical protein